MKSGGSGAPAQVAVGIHVIILEFSKISWETMYFSILLYCTALLF